MAVAMGNRHLSYTGLVGVKAQPMGGFLADIQKGQREGVMLRNTFMEYIIYHWFDGKHPYGERVTAEEAGLIKFQDVSSLLRSDCLLENIAWVSSPSHEDALNAAVINWFNKPAEPTTPLTRGV